MVLPVTFCHWRAVPSRSPCRFARRTGARNRAGTAVLQQRVEQRVHGRQHGRALFSLDELGDVARVVISVRREPWRMASRHSVSAKMWYSGSAAMLLMRSGHRSGPAPNEPRPACNVAAMMLHCEHGPDSPVVPPVYPQKAAYRAWSGRVAACGAPSARAFFEAGDLAAAGQRQLVGGHHLLPDGARRR